MKKRGVFPQRSPVYGFIATHWLLCFVTQKEKIIKLSDIRVLVIVCLKKKIVRGKPWVFAASFLCLASLPLSAPSIFSLCRYQIQFGLTRGKPQPHTFCCLVHLLQLPEALQTALFSSSPPFSQPQGGEENGGKGFWAPRGDWLGENPDSPGVLSQGLLILELRSRALLLNPKQIGSCALGSGWSLLEGPFLIQAT